MNRVLIAVGVLLLLGPMWLQASLWSSVIAIRCTHVNAAPYDVRCEVKRDAWVAHEEREVTVRGASAFRVRGISTGRGDAWIAVLRYQSEETIELTPRINVAKGDMATSAETLDQWLNGETWRDDVKTSYGSPLGAFYVPILSSIACVMIAFLVTQRVRLRMIQGGRVVVDASLWLGPRAPFEIPIDDIRCFSFAGQALVLVTKDGHEMVARSVMPKRAELVVDQGNAWLEEARRFREGGAGA
jgi:hypothetical protein